MKCTTLSAIGLFLGSINATPLQSLNPRSGISLSGYTYEGCYTEATNGRALTGGSYFDDSLTVEKCAAACKKFTLFGVEYGRECYCGNNLNAGSNKAALGDCNFKCSGDASETCGAGNRLDLYNQTGPPAHPWTAKGCYTDDPNNRTLKGPSSSSDSQSVELCAATCKGYAYFGVEYFRECYCGNTVSPSGVPAAASQCDAACSGDSGEICGGASRLNLYQFT